MNTKPQNHEPNTTNQTPVVTTIRYQVEHADPGQANWQQIKPILENEPFARAIARAAMHMHMDAGKTQQYRIVKQEHTILPMTTSEVSSGLRIPPSVESTPQEPPKTTTLSAPVAVRQDRGEGRGEVQGAVHGSLQGSAPKKLKKNGTPKQSGGPRRSHTRNLTDGPGARIRAIIRRLPEPFTSAEVRQMNTDPAIDSTLIAQFLYLWTKNGELKISKQDGPRKWYVRVTPPATKALEQIRTEIQVPRDPDAGNY